MLQQQRFSLVFTATLILVAAVSLLWGQINPTIQPETIFSHLTINSQLRYIDQASVASSGIQDFQQDYVVLSALLLIFACLTWCSNSCLCRWLPHKENKNRE